jgi:hypothetical protein
MSIASRQPRGVRTGGQFVATSHAEAGVSLAPSSAAAPGDLVGPGSLADRDPAWTPSAIKKFLGDPDKLVTNPVYRTAPKMRMFRISRVEQVEATDEWATWQEANRRRRASTTRTADKEPVALVGHGRGGFYPVVRR